MMWFKMRWILSSGVLASVLLTGCSGFGNVPPAAQQLDLGAPTVVAAPPAAAQAQRTLVLPPLASANMLQGMSVIWRVGAEGQPNSYATYQWSAPPESLVRERLISRLSADFAVLSSSVSSNNLMLRVNLMQFEQIYSADGMTNQGVVSMQAILLRGDQVLGQYRDTVSVPGQRNDATAGAVALRVATDQLADKLANWLKSVELPRNLQK